MTKQGSKERQTTNGNNEHDRNNCYNSKACNVKNADDKKDTDKNKPGTTKKSGKSKKIVLYEKMNIKEEILGGSEGSKKAKGSKKSEKVKPDDKDLKPYREIVFSDGSGFYIKTSCSITTKGRIQVVQYREHIDPEGTKFACSEPEYFENKDEFLEWLVTSVKDNFDQIPYITISPLDTKKIKKKERDATDTMYL
jgi:hypothetical protein